ncbi:hypothetical protein CR513_42230, partial [Mucuna pruriens]
ACGNFRTLLSSSLTWCSSLKAFLGALESIVRQMDQAFLGALESIVRQMDLRQVVQEFKVKVREKKEERKKNYKNLEEKVRIVMIELMRDLGMNQKEIPWILSKIKSILFLVEQNLECIDYDDMIKVKLIALSFKRYALIW